MSDADFGPHGPFVLWTCDWDGWRPQSFDTLEEAREEAERYPRLGDPWVVTSAPIASSEA